MSLNESKRKELEELLAALETGNLDAPAKVRLNAIISQSSEARRIYLDHCQMQAMLKSSALAVSLDEKDAANTVITMTRGHWSKKAWAGIAAAACAMFLIGAAASHLASRDQSNPPALAETPAARVTNLSGTAELNGTRLSVGDDVTNGSLIIESGSLELQFTHGSILLVEGQSDLIIETDMQVVLNDGKVAARISEEGHGFTILGPDSAVVDLGTEFAMAVADGQGFVEVYDGEVDVALLNQNGHAWKSRLLTPSGPVEFDSASGTIAETETAIDLPRIMDPPPVGLNVPRAYANAVINSGPAHYWRFDEFDGSQTKDEVNEASAEIEGGVESNQNGLYYPPGKKHHGSVFIGEVNPDVFSCEFTLEAWVNPAFPQRRVLFGIEQHGDSGSAPMELYKLDLMPPEQRTLYPGETFRFSANLLPHGEQGEVSAFSSEPYLEGEWHHVVVVRHHDRFEVYINGTAGQSTPLPIISENQSPVSVHLGRGGVPRNPTMKTDRSFFKGQLDEVAIYPGTLSADEIAEHYRLMQIR